MESKGTARVVKAKVPPVGDVRLRDRVAYHLFRVVQRRRWSSRTSREVPANLAKEIIEKSNGKRKDMENKQKNMNQKIRIRLKSFDHNLVDNSAEKIVKTVKSTGAVVSGPVPLPTRKQIFYG